MPKPTTFYFARCELGGQVLDGPAARTKAGALRALRDMVRDMRHSELKYLRVDLSKVKVQMMGFTIPLT